MTNNQPRYTLAITPSGIGTRDSYIILVNGKPAIRVQGYNQATAILAATLDVLERDLYPIDADCLRVLAEASFSEMWEVCDGW